MIEFLKDWQLVFRAIYFAIFVLTAAVALRAWVRHGFWVPRYVHVLALLAFAVAAVLVWLGRSVGDMPDRTAILFLLGFPLFVYLYFVLHGGAMHGPRTSEDEPAAMPEMHGPNEDTLRIQQLANEPYRNIQE
jgi:uncharacterized membrane protein YoaK (UPF0700 family)